MLIFSGKLTLALKAALKRGNEPSKIDLLEEVLIVAIC